jgi:hypothetical protein
MGDQLLSEKPFESLFRFYEKGNLLSLQRKRNFVQTFDTTLRQAIRTQHSILEDDHKQVNNNSNFFESSSLGYQLISKNIFFSNAEGEFVPTQKYKLNFFCFRSW